MDNNDKLIPIDDVLTLMVAGNFTFTLTSKKTNDSYTYNIKFDEHSAFYEWYVLVLDKHTNKYIIIGQLDYDKVVDFTPSDIAKFQPTATKAFQYLLHIIKCGMKGLHIEIRSVGKCCVCGRRLIDKDSIDKNIGPECEKKHKEFIQEILT